MPRPYRVLTDEEIEHFLTRGFVRLRNCFTREAARSVTDTALVRLGYDPHDPATWTESIVHMPHHRAIDVREFAPKVWDAACDLLGGEERIAPFSWGDGFIINLRHGADRPWDPPSPKVKGWHKDGSFFKHFLDSPEQGLLTVVLWSDVQSRGGATFVATDSVPVVARFMAEHPEGVRPDGGFDSQALIDQCHDFAEATGEVGDVYLLHPYMLHASSQNVLGIPRLITNPPVSLREPMDFDRENPDDFSPVELAILRGLGVDRLDFRPTTPRELIESGQVARHRQMMAEEKERLARAAQAG